MKVDMRLFGTDTLFVLGRKFWWIFFTFLFLAILFFENIGTSHAQTPTPPPDLTATVGQLDTSAHPNITLYLTVTDKDGNYVGDLTETDFQITEDGAPVTLQDFAGIGEERLVDIVFVFDTTSSMEDEINGVIETSLAFADELERKGRDYRLGLVTFGDEVLVVQRPDNTLADDAEEFKGWVSALRADGGGDVNENDYAALKRALDMDFRPDTQKIFLLITDAPPHEYGDPPDEGHPFDDPDLTQARMQTLLTDASVALYTISPDYPEFTALSAATGGSFYDLTNSPDFTAIIEDLGAYIASQYRITYISPRPANDGTQRNIVVEVGGTVVEAEYLEEHLLSIESNLLIGALLLLPLLFALIVPGLFQIAFQLLKPQPVVGAGNTPGNMSSNLPGNLPGPVPPASPPSAYPLPPAPPFVPAPVTPAMSQPCPYCGRALRVGAKFCAGCGNPVQAPPPPAAPPVAHTTTCPQCGNPVQPGTKFCATCGNQL